MSEEKTTTLVIIGASGDLARRKLLPALYTVYCNNRLPDNFEIIGFARSKWTTEEFQAEMRIGVEQFAREPFDEAKWNEFAPKLHYLAGDATDAGSYVQLKEKFAELEEGEPDRLFYLSVPPRFFPPIVRQLGACDMVQEVEGKGWRRVIIEKPFGSDLASAQQLNREIHEVLDEDQIYRIDHYLAKETVQNLMVFRFGNAIFEPLWNRNYIKNVQITAAESVDVGTRAGYYDHSGVLRDMFQNHLLQLLTLTAMEPPASFDANAIRNEKVKVLSAIRPIPATELAQNSVRGQYNGYQDADGVADESTTPTYAALRLFVDNWRWRGVPFYLRSGKALKRKNTEITIQFRRPPHMMFPLPDDYEMSTNTLSMCIQPDEGIHLRIEAKVPDTDADMRTVNLDFHYDESFGENTSPQAYERLLQEAIEGDASLFTRGDAIELAWGIIDPIISGWEGEHAPPMTQYERGSWGPSEGNDLLDSLGHQWTIGCCEE